MEDIMISLNLTPLDILSERNLKEHVGEKRVSRHRNKYIPTNNNYLFWEKEQNVILHKYV